MTKPIILLILSSIFTSCVSTNYYDQYQVVQIKSNNVKNYKAEYVFEDNNIILRYNFWNTGSGVAFAIINKSKKDIYIDWSKSKFIVNDKFFGYWQDQNNNSITTISNYRLFNSDELNIYSKYVLVKSRGEKITQVPPRSYLIIHKFSLNDFIDLPLKYDLSAKEDKSKVYSDKFNNKNTPLKFRNFIVYSFSKSMAKPIKIDNEFWISSILYMRDTYFYFKGMDREYKTRLQYESKNSFYKSVETAFKKEESKKTIIGQVLLTAAIALLGIIIVLTI